MSKAHEKVKELLGESEEAAVKAVPTHIAANTAAAKVLENAERPADVPSPVQLDLDFDFLNYDPTDIAPYLESAKIERDASLGYRWVNRSKRQYDRRIWEGWRPVQGKGGPILRGDLVLMSMPQQRLAAIGALLKKRTALREDAPMERFESEVRREVASGNFTTFDDTEVVRARR